MITAVLSTDYQGNPRIKITADCPQITLDVYTEDINYLKSLVDKELIIKEKGEDD